MKREASRPWVWCHDCDEAHEEPACDPWEPWEYPDH